MVSRRHFIGFLVAGIALLPAGLRAQALVAFEKSALVIETKSGKHKFTVEVAVSDRQQAQGLMFRQSMAPDAGMLFDYKKPTNIHMWMKNTFIPLDMIFIAADGRIINIAQRTVPHSETTIPSRGRALAVLEVNAGTASRLGIKRGDRVIHPIFKNRWLARKNLRTRRFVLQSGHNKKANACFWVSFLSDNSRDSKVVSLATGEAFAFDDNGDPAINLLEAIEAIPDGFVLYDAEDRLVVCNQKYKVLFPNIAELLVPGAKFEDIIRGAIGKGNVPEALGQEEEWIAERLALHLNPDGPYELKLADGRYIRVAEFQTANGGIVGTRTDITEANLNEQALLESEGRFRDFANSASDRYWETDEEHRLVALTDSDDTTARMLSELKPIGKRRWEIEGVSSEDNWASLKDDLDARRPFKNYLTKVDLHGLSYYRQISGVPVFGEDGRFKGYRGTMHDITNLIEREQDAHQARQEAEQANRAKTEFLSAMSSRTSNAPQRRSRLRPTDQEFPDSLDVTKLTRYASEILRSGDLLLDLLNQVLELSRIESGKVQYTIEAVDLGHIVDEALRLLARRAEMARIKLINFCEPGKMPLVATDQNRVRQVVLNLLSNAIKYNRKDGSVSVTFEAPEDGTLKLDITDTGVGIPAAHQDKIFEPFDRLGREASDVEGFGIGLTISRQIIERLGGEIGFESKENVGSMFWIKLPISDAEVAVTGTAEIEDKATALPDARQGARVQVVYVEDNPSNIELMEEVIDAGGNMDMVSFGTAEEALEKMPSLKPDIILLDINLPGMDGNKALQDIRKDPLYNGVPVFALTAAAMPDEVRAGQLAGFDEYIVKPIVGATFSRK